MREAGYVGLYLFLDPTDLQSHGISVRSGIHMIRARIPELRVTIQKDPLFRRNLSQLIQHNWKGRKRSILLQVVVMLLKKYLMYPNCCLDLLEP